MSLLQRNGVLLEVVGVEMSYPCLKQAARFVQSRAWAPLLQSVFSVCPESCKA